MEQKIYKLEKSVDSARSAQSCVNIDTLSTELAKEPWVANQEHHRVYTPKHRSVAYNKSITWWPLESTCQYDDI